LAAIESGRQVMRLVPVAVGDLLLGPVERLKDQAERRNVSTILKLDPEMRVLADREQAARAVLNVLHNAIKYSPEGGEVVISAEEVPEEGRVILSITDAGPGIPPDELERVFERFYRSNWAWGTPGTGLGLAIARHILQAHGGRIWAENRRLPERGAIFHLAFPAA
jgi:two-component system phosphate regulon sensor histidine kinase PhoR